MSKSRSPISYICESNKIYRCNPKSSKLKTKWKMCAFLEIDFHAKQCAFTVFHAFSRYFHGPFFCFFSFQVASPIKLFSAIDKSSSRKSHHSTLMETLMIFFDSLSRFRLRLMKCKFSHAILVQVAYAVLLFYNELGTRQEK